MYEPHPESHEIPPEPSRPAIPGPVRIAVMLMYAGAALSAIGLVVTIFSFHAIERIIRNAPSANTLTQHQVHSVAIATVTIGVVEGLIATGLWLLMAWANKQGRSWARITATVLFVADTLLTLTGFSRGPRTPIDLVFPVLTWLVGAGAVWLLWRPESSAFFKTQEFR